MFGILIGKGFGLQANIEKRLTRESREGPGFDKNTKEDATLAGKTGFPGIDLKKPIDSWRDLHLVKHELFFIVNDLLDALVRHQPDQGYEGIYCLGDSRRYDGGENSRNVQDG